MTKEWGLVALSCAIMVLAGAIVAAGFFGDGFSVGSVGQWASAVATLTAVWVALRNTARTIETAEMREKEKERVARESYILAVATLARELRLTAHIVAEKTGGVSLKPAAAMRIQRGMQLDGLVAALDRLPLHTSPHPIFVATVSSLRTAAFNVARMFDDIATSTEGGELKFDAEFKLIESTVAGLEHHLLEEEELPFDFSADI